MSGWLAGLLDAMGIDAQPRGLLDAPVGTSTMQRMTNASPTVSPMANPYFMTSEQRMGRFWDAATGRAKNYTNADLPALAASGREGMDNALGWAGMTTPIRAYHGSPHTFDRFDMSKLGTGEGAQAYGHGLYFAGAEDVARSYKQSVMRNADELVNIAKSNGLTGDGAEMLAHQTAMGFGGKRFDDWIDVIRSSVDDPLLSPRVKAAMQQILDKQPEAADAYARMKAPGSMYEVNLRTSPERLLDWDKPLSQQPAGDAAARALGVKPTGGWRGVGTEFERFGPRGAEANVRQIDRGLGDGPEWLATYDTLYDRGTKRFPTLDAAKAWIDKTAPIEGGRGAEVYQAARKTMSDADISAALKANGLDGIQYLDAGSRAAGDGSRNYVMFDDKLIDILRRYGLLGLLGGGAAAVGAEQ